uniref:Putative secreted protein n=1 Tax=Psorophora albipes TaxID=869069 RepID=T1E2W7_9DIPT
MWSIFNLKTFIVLLIFATKILHNAQLTQPIYRPFANKRLVSYFLTHKSSQQLQTPPNGPTTPLVGTSSLVLTR